LGRSAYYGGGQGVRHLIYDPRRDPDFDRLPDRPRAESSEMDLVGALELPQVHRQEQQVRLHLEEMDHVPLATGA
jgi:hypothetical protein